MIDNVMSSLGGGAKVKTGTYIGEGESGSNNLNMITFPEGFVPKLVIIQMIDNSPFGATLILPVKDDNTSTNVPSISTSGGSGPWTVYGVTTSFNHQYNRIGWYSNAEVYRQLNARGIEYKWVAIGE